MATMTSPNRHSSIPVPTRGGWKRRALVVVAAVAASLAVWSVARLSGVDLTVQRSGGGVDHVGAALVAAASALAGLAGWGLLAILERFAPRARAIWTTIAFVVLVVSLTGPLGAGTTAGAKGALVGLHLAVAAALIPGFSRRAVDRPPR